MFSAQLHCKVYTNVKLFTTNSTKIHTKITNKKNTHTTQWCHLHINKILNAITVNTKPIKVNAWNIQMYDIWRNTIHHWSDLFANTYIIKDLSVFKCTLVRERMFSIMVTRATISQSSCKNYVHWNPSETLITNQYLQITFKRALWKSPWQ